MHAKLFCLVTGVLQILAYDKLCSCCWSKVTISVHKACAMFDDGELAHELEQEQ